MKLDILSALAVILTILVVSCNTVFAAEDAKFCGVVVHDLSTGKLHRSTSQITAYKKLYPLPADLDPTEWQIDHPDPLECGGCDTPTNMSWMHKSIKTCALDNPGKVYCKDRYEKKVFCTRPVTHIYVN